MMVDEVTFGKWLRRRRRELDLTQQELAERVGCGVTTIRKIEGGERRPSKELAAQLAVGLDIAPEEHARFILFARTESYPDRPLPPAPAARPPVSSSVPAVTTSPPPFLVEETALEKPAPVFVARERELAELETALESAQAGQGQILFIIGGAGRGKTMLIQEFARWAQAADPELVAVSGNCNAHTGQGDPYLPFREALAMLTGEVEAKWAAGLITSSNARRLWELMPLTVPVLVKQAPDLIESFVPAEPLLERAASFAAPDATWFQRLTTMAAPDLSPGLQQKQILTQYTILLKTVAAQRPLLLILEDLHWVDVSSNALLFHLSRELENDRLLIVGSYRPDEVASNRGQEHHPLAGILGELKRRYGDIWLDLGDPPPAEGQRFVTAYLDTQPNRLGRAFREALFHQTEGHPLFAVELIREMAERGDVYRDAEGYWVAGEAIDWATLPARVEGVIEQRIGRLRPELQAILTAASVEGDIFTAEVVARVQQLNDRELVQQLSQELDKKHRLVKARAVDRVGQQRLSLYRFRHHLFQRYLYHHLDELERAYLHEAVGQALEALYGEQTEPVAVQLARHFEQAGLAEKAVRYLLQAGQRAGRLSANEEAIGHLRRGLALLQILPDTPERIQQELAFQITLGNALVATKGYAAPEVSRTYSQARALYQHAFPGETSQLFPVLHGLHRYHLLRGDFPAARELGEQMLQLAQDRQDPLLLVPAQQLVGSTLLWLGKFALAQTHLERGLALYDSQQHSTYVLLYGQDEGVACLTHAACSLWSLGYPDQAVQRSHEAIALAEKRAHHFSIAYALSFSAWTHRLRREARAVQEQTEEVMALSTEYGFATWLALGAMHRGWALTEQGQGEEGIVQLSQGLTAWRETEAELTWHYFLGLMAEAYANIGQVNEGLIVVNEALAAVPTTGRFWEAELHRLKGALLLKSAGGEMKDELTPEACFLTAIEIAQRQQAKSLELRATVSLAQLWQSQGKREEARQLLAEIYDWFTEGFDTVDLQEAETLLAILS